MPLEVDPWKEDLACHLKSTTFSMESGFQIGFNHTCSLLRGNIILLLSTVENPDFVDDYMQKELSESSIAKVVNLSGLLSLQVSLTGVIPKLQMPGPALLSD